MSLVPNQYDRGMNDGWNNALEEAAKLCESHAIYYRDTQPVALVKGAGEPVGVLFAAAIRELKF